MNGIGFFWKVFGGMVAVVLITASVIYFSVLPALNARVTHATEQSVVQSAALVAELAAAGWNPERDGMDLESMERASAGMPGCRVTLIAADGRVAFDSHQDPTLMDNHLSRAEMQTPGVPVIRHSRTLGKEMTYCVTPVMVGSEHRGFARAAIATVDLEARAEGLWHAIRNGVLLASLASLLFAAFFARHVTGPLSRIAALVGEVREGGGLQRLKIEGADEVAQLARAVNDMTENLGTQIQRIESDRAERQAILSTMTDGVLALDHEQRVLFINGPACHLLKVDEVQAVGAPLWEWTRHSGLRDLLLRCEELAQPVHGQGHFEGPAGERSIEMSAAPLVELEGVERGCVLVFRDVTELRHLEGVRRDFVSNVSHELKTPLTAMSGYLEAVLLDGEMETAQRQTFLTKAMRNTERLTAIVTDLLSLSRLESNGEELQSEPRDAWELIHETIDELRDLADDRGVELVSVDTSGPVTALVDSQSMRLALSNLISNGIRYSPRGAQLRLYVCVDAGEVRFDVEDQGDGIPAQDLERIFERFYRVDKARSRGLGGTGLGLAIVRHAMGAMGGRVEVQSELGQGSTFSLFLPQA